MKLIATYVTLLLMVVAISKINGQNNSIDSIKLLLTKPQPDSIRALHNLNLSKTYLSVNLDSALKFANEALIVANDANLKILKAGASTNIGIALYRLANADSAKYYYDQALQLYEETGNQREVARANVRLATYYDYKGYFDLSIRANIEAIEVFEVLQDTFNLGITYYNLGSTYGYKNERDKEVENYLKSLELTKAINDTEGIAWAYSGLYNAYTIVKNYNEAIKMLRKEQLIREQLGAPYFIGKVFFNYSKYYKHIDQYDSAEYYLLKAMDVFRENGFKADEANCYDDLGIIYHARGMYPEAIEAYKKSMVGLLAVSPEYSLVVPKKDLAITYMAIKDYSGARTILREALDQSIKDNYQLHIKDVLEQLYKLDSLTGNWQSAFLYYQQLSDLKNELTIKENTNNLQQLNIIFETEQRDEEIANLKRLDEEKEKTLQAEIRQKYLMSLVTGITVVFLFIGFILFNRLKKSRNEITRQKSSLELLNQTKDRFFGIIAHDLRGPITALKGITDLLAYSIKAGKTDKLPKIASQIESSSNRVNTLLDNLLNWAMSQQGAIPYRPDKYSLKELVEDSLHYFEDMALAKQIKIDCQIASEFEILGDKETLSTVFRNLVNNSIKFTNAGGNVSITAVRNDHQIEILLKDNGVGMTPDQITKIFSLDPAKISDGTAREKGSGLGLTLVKDFVQLNHGKITVKSERDQGSEFLISLPEA